MEKKKILIIGSLNLDLVVNVDHMPAVGETILSQKMDQIPGGKGANQACAAGRLGADTVMLGAVGQDTYADILFESLTGSGVDVSHIIQRKEETTGVALITVNKEGNNSIVVVSGANASLSVEDIEANRQLIEDSEVVIFQMEIPLETVCYGAKLAKSLGKTVILDPAPAPKVFPEELYPLVDVIKPNETELSILTGMDAADYEKASDILREKGVREVLVTLGEHGVYLNSATVGKQHIPGYSVEAVDTTAAGDTFTAALGMMLTREKNMAEAAAFANGVSAMVVMRKGAQSSIPSLEEIRSCEFLDETLIQMME